MDTKDGKRILFFYSLDKEKLTIGSVDCVGNSLKRFKKYEYFTKDRRGVNYKIYPLPDGSILLETVYSSNSGYMVIPYSDFK